jgi:molybdopterin-guanine dinucleotide biosynthesis protein A
MELTGILIAGGRSLRMGSDKAALLFHGTTFAQHAIGLLKTLCSTVMVSYNGEPFANDVTFIKDIYPGSGTHLGLTRGTHCLIHRLQFGDGH